MFVMHIVSVVACGHWQFHILIMAHFPGQDSSHIVLLVSNDLKI